MKHQKPIYANGKYGRFIDDLKKRNAENCKKAMKTTAEFDLR